MIQYRCQLERLGAPHWVCGLGGTIVALIILATAAIISKSLWGVSTTPAWVLPLIWTLAAFAIALAVRSVLSVFRSPSDGGATGPGGAGQSNNRWRGP
jgi:tellurite resistance protein TehA-like permease